MYSDNITNHQNIFPKKRTASLTNSTPAKISNRRDFRDHVFTQCCLQHTLSIYLPIRLNPRGGRQMGIPEYQVLRGSVETK